MVKNTFLYKVIENKTVAWFKNNNEYLVLENTTADILKRLNKGIPVNDVATALSKKLAVPLDKTTDFIIDLEKRIHAPKSSDSEKIINDYRDVKKPKNYNFIKFYKINNKIFRVRFLDEQELSFIHPKFAHLVVDNTTDYDANFDVFINHKYIFLYVNNEFIGAWSRKEIHFFQGKFSMQLIQKIHNKEEEEWMGIFHASAVSNTRKSILFLGDSGNGKSTSLSLLQANGFTCLADDFVPIDIENKAVYSFPAAISIKKDSLKTLLPIYPELATSAEYNFKRLNKIVRFLKPNNNNFYSYLPCKELVFIKYEKNAGLKFNTISKIEAFQKLIPDSWLSPLEKNAQVFLDWFESITCYEITYSENDKMIKTVAQLFKDEL